MSWKNLGSFVGNVINISEKHCISQNNMKLLETYFLLFYTGIVLSIYLHIYKLINELINWPIDLLGRVFTNAAGDGASISSLVIPKTQKLYLNPPWLTLSGLKIVSRVKWTNPQYLRAIAIKKGAFALSSTTISQLYLYIYIYFL